MTFNSAKTRKYPSLVPREEFLARLKEMNLVASEAFGRAGAAAWASLTEEERAEWRRRGWVLERKGPAEN